jgi:hypothetical protein
MTSTGRNVFRTSSHGNDLYDRGSKIFRNIQNFVPYYLYDRGRNVFSISPHGKYIDDKR